MVCVALLATVPAIDTVLAARIQISAKVPAAKWKAVRLRNLPKDAAVQITLETSGIISVIFVHQEELRRFPAAVNPVFQGTADHRLSFRVVVPTSGNYYVILDNRPGKEERKVRLLIQAEPRRRQPSVPQPQEAPKRAMPI